MDYPNIYGMHGDYVFYQRTAAIMIIIVYSDYIIDAVTPLYYYERNPMTCSLSFGYSFFIAASPLTHPTGSIINLSMASFIILSRADQSFLHFGKFGVY